MIKIVLCSDNHSHLSVLQDIVSKNSNADYYWHLGDSECYKIDDIKPFISVMGNIDFNTELPQYRILEVGGHRFMLTHGHKQSGGLEILSKYGKDNDCDVVLYGHTHRPNDCVIDGIRLINPGSCFNNRNGLGPTYCILKIDDDGIINADYIEIDNVS